MGNRSLGNVRWFYGKKKKLGRGNLYLTENRLSWNEMYCAADNHNYMCHTCAKEFLDLNFNQAVINIISDFHEIAPNSTYSHKSYFFKYICNFLDQLLHPSISWQRHVRNTLFHFCQLWAFNSSFLLKWICRQMVLLLVISIALFSFWHKCVLIKYMQMITM